MIRRSKINFVIGILLFLVMVVSKDFQECVYTFSEQEVEIQKEMNKQIMKELSSQIKTQQHDLLHRPHFLIQLIRHVKSKNKVFQPYSTIASQHQNGFNFPYLRNIAIFLSAIVLIYLLMPIITKCTVNLAFRDSQYCSRIFKMVFILIFSLILVASLEGAREGFKQRKSSNSIICRLLNEPQGLIRGSASTDLYGFQALQNHISLVQRSIQQNLTQSLQSLSYRLNHNQPTIKVMNFILDSLEDKQKKGLYQFEVIQAKRILQEAQKKYKENYTEFCQSKLISIGQQLISFSQRIKSFIRAIANENIQQLKLRSSIRYFSNIVTAFFIIIVGAMSTLLILTIKKVQYKVSVPFQLIVGIAGLICIAFYLYSPALITHLYWTNTSATQIVSTENNLITFYEQLTSSKIQNITDLFLYKEKSIQGLEGCFNETRASIDIYRSVIDESDQYFQELGLNAYSKVKKEKKKQLLKMIRQNMNKQNIQGMIRQLYQTQSFLVELFATGGAVDIIRPSAFADYLKQLLTLTSVHSLNRIYNLREIYGHLSRLFLLLFALSFLAIKSERAELFKEKNKGNIQKDFEQLDSQDLQTSKK